MMLGTGGDNTSNVHQQDRACISLGRSLLLPLPLDFAVGLAFPRQPFSLRAQERAALQLRQHLPQLYKNLFVRVGSKEVTVPNIPNIRSEHVVHH
jgi:hypothetical protein